MENILVAVTEGNCYIVDEMKNNKMDNQTSFIYLKFRSFFAKIFTEHDYTTSCYFTACCSAADSTIVGCEVEALSRSIISPFITLSHMGYMSAVLRTAQSRNAPDTSFMPSLCWRTQLGSGTKTEHFKKTEELRTLLWIIFQEKTPNNPDSQDSDNHSFNTCETLKTLPATFKNHQTSSMPPRILREVQ